MMYEILNDVMIAGLCAVCLVSLVVGCWLVWSALNGLIPKGWGR